MIAPFRVNDFSCLFMLQKNFCGRDAKKIQIQKKMSFKNVDLP